MYNVQRSVGEKDEWKQIDGRRTLRIALPTANAVGRLSVICPTHELTKYIADT